MSNSFSLCVPPGYNPPHSIGGGIIKEQILAECARQGKLLHEMDQAELDRIGREAAARIQAATAEGRSPHTVRAELERERDDRSTASTLVDKPDQYQANQNPEIQEEKGFRTKMAEGWKRYKQRSEGIILW